jgi:hypothetical protein
VAAEVISDPRAAVLPPCLRCGALPDVEWAEISTFGQAEPSYLPGRSLCPTVGCVDEKGSRWVPLNRCRVCQRPAGDIHSGACSEMVLSKIDDPCRVATVDCGP